MFLQFHHCNFAHTKPVTTSRLPEVDSFTALRALVFSRAHTMDYSALYFSYASLKTPYISHHLLYAHAHTVACRSVSAPRLIGTKYFYFLLNSWTQILAVLSACISAFLAFILIWWQGTGFPQVPRSEPSHRLLTHAANLAHELLFLWWHLVDWSTTDRWCRSYSLIIHFIRHFYCTSYYEPLAWAAAFISCLRWRSPS